MNAMLLTSSFKYQNLQLYLYNMIQNAEYIKQNMSEIGNADSAMAKLAGTGE